jgi:hypothetical protein
MDLEKAPEALFGVGQRSEIRQGTHEQGDEIGRDERDRDDQPVGQLHQTDEEKFLLSQHDSVYFPVVSLYQSTKARMPVSMGVRGA